MSTTHQPVLRCNRISVQREVCYVGFTSAQPHLSSEIEATARGELMIADFDDKGRIMGIELVGPHKPCQEG
jgi:uncharacterized protein YuzE